MIEKKNTVIDVVVVAENICTAYIIIFLRLHIYVYIIIIIIHRRAVMKTGFCVMTTLSVGPEGNARHRKRGAPER